MMLGEKWRRIPGFWVVVMVLVALMPAFVAARGKYDDARLEVRRYGQHEISRRHYQPNEIEAEHFDPIVESPGKMRRFLQLPYHPSGSPARIRIRLADAHEWIKFYQIRTCENCHVEQSRNRHTQRANIPCRRCHGPEPIASINHYRSPMNPVRKHDYVCAKCHQGAGESFGAYVIHEPLPMSLKAKRSFSSLYYAYWVMFIILVGTLAFFIPHAVLVGLRELLECKVKTEKDSENVHQEIQCD